MPEFEANVTNSLASMQAAVVSLESKVDKADKSLARMAKSAKEVASAHHQAAGEAAGHSAAVEKLERGMEGSRKSARLLGGEAGSLTREFTELATNPWSLAAGGAFALVGGAIELVTDHIKELREETEELVRVGESGVKGKAGAVKGAIDQTNVQEDRRRAFERQAGPVPSITQVPEESQKDVLAAADQAVAAGMAKSQEEFVAKLLAAERPALDAFRKGADDQRAVRRAVGSGPNDAYTVVSRALGDKEGDHTRAPDVEQAPNPFTGKSAAQLAVTGTGADISPDDFAERLRRAEQTETGRLARVVEQRKRAEEAATESARLRGLRTAAGETGGANIEDVRKNAPAVDAALGASEARQQAIEDARSLRSKAFGGNGSNFALDFASHFSGSPILNPDAAAAEERERRGRIVSSAMHGGDAQEGAQQRDAIFKQAADAAARQEELMKQQVEQSKQTLQRFSDLIDAVKTTKKGTADADAQVDADVRVNRALSQQASEQAATNTYNR